MSYDDTKVRKGQAYNLAVMTAIADGKHHDNVYITKQFLRHYQFAALCQKGDVNQLAAITECPKIIELFNEVTKSLGG